MTTQHSHLARDQAEAVRGRVAWQGRALGPMKPLSAWGRSVGRQQGEALAGPFSLSCPWGQSQQSQPRGSWKQLGSALPQAPASTLSSSSVSGPEPVWARSQGCVGACSEPRDPGSWAVARAADNSQGLGRTRGPRGPRSRARGSVKAMEPVLLKRKRELSCVPQPTAAGPGDREGV